MSSGPNTSECGSRGFVCLHRQVIFHFRGTMHVNLPASIDPWFYLGGHPNLHGGLFCHFFVGERNLRVKMKKLANNERTNGNSMG